MTAPQGEAYDIKRPANGPQPVLLQGWLQRDTAVDLFRKAGLDFGALKLKARQADFHPVTLGAETVSADFTVTHSDVESHNVLAKLVGTKHPDQTVIYAAHWDAYGIGKPDAKGDPIRHGANDDGLGVAGVLEIARAFKAAPPPERTVVLPSGPPRSAASWDRRPTRCTPSIPSPRRRPISPWISWRPPASRATWC